MDQLVLDLRFAIRSLLGRPGFSATAVATLALAVGASVAIFSVVNTVLLRPLPYPEADRIVTLETFWANTGQSSQEVSGPDFLDWQAQSDVFEVMAAYNGGDNLGNDFPTIVGDRAVFANARFVTRDFFAVFGQSASAGRLLTQGDVQEAEPTVAVVANQWATTYFGSAQAAVGKTIDAYDTRLEIVGVAERGFDYPGAADIWVPSPANHPDRSHHTYRAVGKLKSGIELSSAQAQMRTIGDNLAREYSEGIQKTVMLTPLQERITGGIRGTLWMFMGGVMVLLLIACANVSNMLLARASVRKREVSLRAALGAERGRLVRQLLTEGWVLASLAVIPGLLLAFVLVQGLMALSPADLPRLDEVGVDTTVLLFALGLTFLTTLLFGLAPAIHASRLDLSHAMAQGGSRGTSSSSGSWFRGALVVSEVALSVVLLTSAGLLLGSFQGLQRVDLGFTTERVLVAFTEYPVEDLEDIRARSGYYSEALESLRALPGVNAAAGVAYLGMGREPRAARDYFIRGQPEGQPGERPQAELHAITPGYFETLEIPLRAGRDFAAYDAAQPGSAAHSGPMVAIVNEALAQAAFPGVSPLGRRIRTSERAPWMEIVGVVGDTRWQDPASEAPPVIFVPSTQDWGNSLSILVRSPLDEGSLTATLQALLHDADPNVAVSFATMDEMFADAIAYPRFRSQLTGALAGAALLLAALGIFSVLAYVVGQRTREIAVRRAMGATATDVVRLVVIHSSRWITIGLALGLAGALAAARLLEGLLYEISPWDVGILLGGVVVLGTAALIATLVPAVRAAGIAPRVALQQE